MRWITARSVSGNEIYQLYKSEKKILTLSFNPFSNSARIEFDKEKRVFLVRKEGFLKKKIVLRNEYGVKIGELGQEHKQEFIDMNDQRFYYATRNNPGSELVLYKESIEKPVVICSLNTDNGNTSININEKSGMDVLSHSGLLIALCWYLFLPAARENEVQYTS